MKNFLIFCTLICHLSSNSQTTNWLDREQTIINLHIPKYTVSNSKLIGWGLCAIGSFSNGVVQGYQFDNRTSLERKWGVNPYSYGGHLSWAKRYKNHDVSQGLSHPLYRFLPVPDFYHTMQFTQNYSTLSGGIIIGISGARVNKKAWQYGLDLLFTLGISVTSRSIGLYWIRN